MNLHNPNSPPADAPTGAGPADLQKAPENYNRRSATAGIVNLVSLGPFVIVSIFFGIWTFFGTLPLPAGPLALVCLASTTVVASYSRVLPFQNVMLASASMGAIGMFVAALGALLKMGIGLFRMGEAPPLRVFLLNCLLTALLWIVFLLCARSVARWTLRAQRDRKYYGLWTLALTAGLAVCLVANAQPLLASTFHFPAATAASLAAPRQPLTWLPLLSWLGTAIAALLAGTSSLFDKRNPHRPGMPAEAADRPPMVVWLLLNAAFMAFSMKHRCWGYSLILPCSLAVLVCVRSGLRCSITRAK